MKKSIHLTNQSVAYMAARAPEGEVNFSASINAAFEQLEHIARAEMPTLDDAEFAELCNVYAGSDLNRIALPLNIAADLLMHYGAAVPSQLPKETAALVERLARLTQAEKFAIIDAVRVFWHAQE